MKKLFLLGFFSASFVMVAEAQTAPPAVQIGTTTYDLQSNGSSGNRIYKHSDGTISVVWTEQCTVSGGTWPDRGIGYNYWDGSTWINGADGTCPDQFGIASVRVGWPEITGFPSGREMTVSHSPLKETSRPTKGTGAWSTTTDIAGLGQGNTWPRMVSEGAIAHMVASGNAVPVNGVDSGISYYRSTDEGMTWTEIMLPGMDGTSFNTIGGDNYAIHANNGVVAIVAGDFESDWVMWKSTDAGLTWTKKIIREFDIADADISAAGDTTYVTNDGYHAVLVDNNGRVHAWAGAFVVGLEALATNPNGYDAPTIFPQTEGLWYWNDALATDDFRLLVEEREDIHSDPASGDWIGNGSYVTPALINSYQGSQTGQPNAALAPNGDIYLVYSAIVEGTSNTGDSTGQSFRDLYIMKGTNGGMDWSCPKNLTLELDGARTDFEEDVFPSVHHMIGADNILHMMWQADDEPGLHVRIDLDPETPNNIMYRAVDVTDINFGTTCLMINSTDEAVNYVNKVAAFPNPTQGTATIQVDLKQASNLQVRVTNVLGQEVQTIAARQYEVGANNITVDLSAQPSGIYLYSIISDDFTVTNRLVKE